jgi:hypothetical protein
MINTEKTGNMVKNMKKLSNSKDNINSNTNSVAVSPVLILVKVKIFQTSSRICLAEQEEVWQKFKRKSFRKI